MLLASAPLSLNAQSPSDLTPMDEMPPSHWAVLGGAGVLGGGAGFGGGLMLANRAFAGCQGGGCVFGWVLLPAAGALVGIPSGVHLANRQPGDFGDTLAISLLAAGAGGILAYALAPVAESAWGETGGLLVIPLTQLVGTVWWEAGGREWHAAWLSRRGGG